MSAIDRKYEVIGVLMALILAALILSYRALTSGADAPAWMPNDRANHHPKTVAPSE